MTYQHAAAELAEAGPLAVAEKARKKLGEEPGRQPGLFGDDPDEDFAD